MPNWIRACATTDISLDEMIRFDHGSQTFVIVRSEDDKFFALDGICSHEKVHLCDGLVMDGMIECPKHNGVFDYRTGTAKRAPACINLKTFPVRIENGEVWVEI
jgi:3-phenylpropionate/trans-cinnamate dioxygenase ferredoxin component